MNIFITHLVSDFTASAIRHMYIGVYYLYQHQFSGNWVWS
jgi:hypothetical protein